MESRDDFGKHRLWQAPEIGSGLAGGLPLSPTPPPPRSSIDSLNLRLAALEFRGQKLLYTSCSPQAPEARSVRIAGMNR